MKRIVAIVAVLLATAAPSMAQNPDNVEHPIDFIKSTSRYVSGHCKSGNMFSVKNTHMTRAIHVTVRISYKVDHKDQTDEQSVTVPPSTSWTNCHVPGPTNQRFEYAVTGAYFKDPCD